MANLALALDRDDLGPQDPRNFSPALAAADQRCEAAPLGFALRQRGAHFAQLDRPSDDPGIERALSSLQSWIDRARAQPRAIRAISTSKWNGLGTTSSAPASKPATAPRSVGPAGDQHHRQYPGHGVWLRIARVSSAPSDRAACTARQARGRPGSRCSSAIAFAPACRAAVIAIAGARPSPLASTPRVGAVIGSTISTRG